MTNYQFLLCLGLIIFMVIWMIVNFILAKVTGKKFDRLLTNHGIPLPPVFSMFDMTPELWRRAAKYADNIAYLKKEAWLSKKPSNWYESFDFRAYASKGDILISRIYKFSVLSVMIAFLILIVSAIFHIK